MKFTYELCFLIEALKLLTVILATAKYQIINAETQTFSNFDFNSSNSHKDSQDSSKEIKEKSKVSKDRNNGFLLKTTIHSNEFQPTNPKGMTELSTFIYSFQTRPDRFENQNLNQFEDRSLFHNSPLFHTMNKVSQEIKDKPERRDFFIEPFYPTFYHRNHYNDYTKSIYHPYLYRRYGLRNLESSFINRGSNWGKLITENHDNNPSRRFYPFEKSYKAKRVPFYSKSTADNPTHSLISFHGSEAAVKSYDHESKNKRHDQASMLYNKNGTLPEILNPQTSTNFDLELLPTKSISLTKFDENKFISNFKNSTEGIQKAHFDQLEQNIPRNFNKEESNENMTENGIKETGFERSDLNNDSEGKTLNLLSSDRVYYEKIPLNSNLSWYVYVNCSRDNCQLTNSTSEAELIDQGWILHNCTSYGCSEMYPKTESVQKFIGLMLLVFSLCVLKIVAFLLVFYYCRHIKLTKESDERKKLKEDEDESNSSFETGRNSKEVKRKIAAERPPKNIEEEPTFTHYNKDVDVTKDEKSKRMSFQLPPIEVNKLDSKIWIPPVLKASPCLLDDSYPAGGDTLVPEWCSEKEVTIFERSENFPKPKRKGRSGIPRLEKWAKSNSRRHAESESKQSKDNCTLPSPGCENDKKKEDLLLLNLDDEICTKNVYSLGNIEKTPDWESFVENDCKSFISLDLGGRESSIK